MAINVESGTTLLLVCDIPTAIAFYRDLLGFDVVQTSPPFDDAPDNFGWAMLRKNQAFLMLNNMYENNIRPSQPDVERSRHHSDISIYFMCRDVDATCSELRAKGIEIRGPFDTYYNMRQAYVSDPDGYSLVFQWPVELK